MHHAAEFEVRAALELMPQLVWTTTADGYHDYYNERWYAFTGMPRRGDPLASAEGWNWKTYLHPDDYDRTIAVWSNCLATGAPYEIEYRFREAATGEYRWFLARALPRRNASGAIVRWFGTCTDIHEQTLTATRLAGAQDALRLQYAEAQALAAEFRSQAHQVEEQSVELEMTNQQLQDQAAELEAQTEELSSSNEELQVTTEELATRMAEAEATEERVSAIIESISDAFCALDAEWRFTYVNRQAEILLARSRDELLGHVIWEVFPETVGTDSYKQYHRAVAERSTVRFEQFHAPLNEWFEVRAYPSVDGLTVYFQYITERKLTERLADFSAEIGHAVTEGGPLASVMQRCCEAAVAHLDAAFARVWVLDMHEPMLQLVASAGQYTHLDGPHGRVRVGEFKIGKIAADRSPVLTNGVVGDPRVSDQAWAAREAMVSFAGYPLIVDGELVGVMALFSRTRKSDREFDALGTAANAVSVAVANARAFVAEREAKQAAQAANNAKSQFIAQMSHELRTPLNAIGGYAELIAVGVHGPVTPAQLTALQRIKSANQSLTALISDILSFAKVESGQLSFRYEDEVDPEESIADAVSLVERQASIARLTLATLPPLGPSVRIRTDPDRLQQILLNLLTNAVKYTPAGGTITISGERVHESFAVTVRDTGPGIPPDRLEAIFDPFVQIDRSMSHPVEGVGLGLSISRSLARALGGDVTVVSEMGAGSAFTLLLPAA